MKQLRIPNTYVIVFAILVLCALVTTVVPGGKPQLLHVFTALYDGFVKQAGIIVFILVVGGAFWLLNSTGAVSAGINRFIGAVGRHDTLVIVTLTILFSLAGAVFGMSEETIPFVGIVVPLALTMGYDAFLGMLMVYVAANIGFSSAFLNPFTVGIAQGMAELPLFSGQGYRVFCWALLTLILIVVELVYAKRIRRVPAVSRIGGEESARLGARQTAILLTLLATVILLVVGVTVWDWYMAEISGLFLAMGIVCGIIGGFSPNRIADEFIAGAKDILSAALVVGLASGIIIIMQDGQIVDRLLLSMRDALEGKGEVASLSAMYGLQTLINLVIPSASAKAAITVPILAPFSDMVGVSRQAMVLAFQFGDGFTNMITPTSGVLIAALGMARIPYTKWVRWAWKMVLAFVLLGLLLLLPTVFLSLAGF